MWIQDALKLPSINRDISILIIPTKQHQQIQVKAGTCFSGNTDVSEQTCIRRGTCTGLIQSYSHGCVSRTFMYFEYNVFFLSVTNPSPPTVIRSTDQLSSHSGPTHFDLRGVCISSSVSPSKTWFLTRPLPLVVHRLLGTC